MNNDLDNALLDLPDKVADSLEKWRKQTLDRERVEALLYLKFKGEDKERSATEIKALINASGGRYEAVVNEIQAEAEYTRLYERLMALKKQASLRTAY